MKGISSDDVFKLMDTFTVIEASCLIAGISPNQAYCDDYQGWVVSLNNKDPDNAQEVFSIAISAISNSIKANKLKAIVIIQNNNTKYLTKADMSKDWLLTHDIDIQRTTIDRDDLTHWLKQKNIFPPIFFPQGRVSDISNTEHKFYSSKLHIIVDAWESLFTADIQSTTIKKYLADWIKSNKDKYKLDISSDQKFNEMAEIANFDKGGSTIVGNPLHHFGVEERIEFNEVKNQPVNPQIYSNIPSKLDTELSDDLPF